LLLLSAVFLSACDGSGGSPGLAGANPVAGPSAVGSGITTVAPMTEYGPETIERLLLNSRIEGQLTVLNAGATPSVVNVAVRDTDISTTMLPNGRFSLEIPQSEIAHTIVLDVSGENIIPDGITVSIPPDAVRVMVSANIAERSAPIMFDLGAGGEMTNPLSPTRVSVAVPANAFEFEDGTLAVGEAQVSITEIDIEDLNGESAWAPNLFGIEEGTSESTVIATLGMSDFYFSQGGRMLQLRPGKNATIRTDMVNTVLIPKGETVAVQAAAGMEVPLWHYDTVEMIWKEEGQSVVVADAESATGFSLSGEVSHFTTWNHDFVVPWTTIYVNVRLVDTDGNVIPDMTVTSHTAMASIVSAQGTDSSGTAWSYPSNWVETRNSSGATSAMHMIAGDLSGEAVVTAAAFDAGTTTMDFLVSNVVAEGSDYAVLLSNTGSESKTFNNSDSDRTVTVDIVVEEDEDDFVPMTYTGTVNVELVDMDGNPHEGFAIESYVITATADTSDFSGEERMTPQLNEMVIWANTQEDVDSGDIVTMNFTMSSLFLQGRGEIFPLLPVTGSKVFYTFDEDSSITLQVTVTDL
jgi:hypothetical protein